MTTHQDLAQLSHHVDAMEQITDQPSSIANSSPLALANLRARLARLQQTIEEASFR